MGAIDAETSENGACRRRPESFAGMPTSTFRSPETTFFARPRPSPLAFRGPTKGASRGRGRGRGRGRCGNGWTSSPLGAPRCGAGWGWAKGEITTPFAVVVVDVTTATPPDRDRPRHRGTVDGATATATATTSVGTKPSVRNLLPETNSFPSSSAASQSASSGRYTRRKPPAERGDLESPRRTRLRS